MTEDSWEVENPFEEQVAKPRLLQPAVPPSKHRGGRVPKMTDRERRIRRRLPRLRIAEYLSEKRLAEALDEIKNG